MVAQALKPPGLSPYGARELKDVARSYMVRAVMAGSTFWVLMFLLALGASVLFLRRSEEVKIPRIDRTPIPPPIYAPEPQTPPTPITRPAAPPKGDVVPVPEEMEVPLEKRIDVPPLTDGSVPKSGEDNNKILIPPDTEQEVPPRPDEPINVDELPEAITRVEPVYPEIARDAGVSGTVYVRVLVGRNGYVRDVFVEPKRSIPMLNEAAIEAARRWVFKPAFTNNKPVSVWVVIPMKFSLH